MTQADAEAMIIDVVCNIQQVSGREAVAVGSTSCPLTDMPGFDSLNGVEATIEVMDRLKVSFDFNNVLVDDSKALTIAESAARLLSCLPKK